MGVFSVCGGVTTEGVTHILMGYQEEKIKRKDQKPLLELSLCISPTVM